MKRTNNKTKIVATLGVVAGLGLAALPAFSYATTNVSGDVQVETEVTSAIAMRIHSNADETCEDTDSDPTTPDVCTNTYGFIGYNPAEAQGPSDPAATAAGAASQATGLSLSSNQTDSTSLYSNIEVRSNTGKFKLEVADADTDTAMRNSDSSITTNEYIPAGVTTTTSGNDTVIDPTVAGWALKGGDITDWTAITANNATPLTIKSVGSNTTNPLAYSSDITVNYAVASGLTKTGVYNDTITYTATALDSNTLPACSSAITEGQSCSENGVEYIRLENGELGTKYETIDGVDYTRLTSGTLQTTIDGVDYLRLADNNLWTKNSQGEATWDNLSSISCPSGTSKPTAAIFQTLVKAYGGTDVSGYGSPYGTSDNDADLYNATGWSGVFWSTTESSSNYAWFMYVDSSNSVVSFNGRSDSYQVICYR